MYVFEAHLLAVIYSFRIICIPIVYSCRLMYTSPFFSLCSCVESSFLSASYFLASCLFDDYDDTISPSTHRQTLPFLFDPESVLSVFFFKSLLRHLNPE